METQKVKDPEMKSPQGRALTPGTPTERLCSAVGVREDAAGTGQESGEMQEVPEEPQGQDSAGVLGSRAGGEAEWGKGGQGWGSPAASMQERPRGSGLRWHLGPAAGLGPMGRLSPPSASQQLLCPSEGLGLWAECPELCSSPDCQPRLGCSAGLRWGEGREGGGEPGRGWAGLESAQDRNSLTLSELCDHPGGGPAPVGLWSRA